VAKDAELRLTRVDSVDGKGRWWKMDGVSEQNVLFGYVSMA
jgi:hypothetical protein